MGLLGVFQKLIASKSNDHEGFYLLGSMVEHFEPWVNTGIIYKSVYHWKIAKKKKVWDIVSVKVLFLLCWKPTWYDFKEFSWASLNF